MVHRRLTSGARRLPRRINQHNTFIKAITVVKRSHHLTIPGATHFAFSSTTPPPHVLPPPNTPMMTRMGPPRRTLNTTGPPWNRPTP